MDWETFESGRPSRGLVRRGPVRNAINSLLLGGLLVVCIIIALELRPESKEDAMARAAAAQSARDSDHARFLERMKVVESFDAKDLELIKIDYQYAPNKTAQELLVEQMHELKLLRNDIEREIELEKLRREYREP
jgi:hypothetical protein